MTKSINEILKEMKDLKAMEDELQAEIEALKEEAIKYMDQNELDEVVAEDGTKATWRETISNRFDSTAFKRVHAELYLAFTKKTAYKRFTLN